jgi:hypothetical protein
VDAAHTIAVLECHQHFLFVLCSEAVILVIVTNAERKGRRMGQHIFHGRATCTNETKAQVGGRFEYDVSPPSANLQKPVPPVFVAPSPQPNGIAFISIKETRSTELKYIEKRIIVEVVDICTTGE